MEHLEAILQAVSYLGVIDKLMGLSATDIAVLFLVSKPAFVLTAGVVVLTSHRGEPASLPQPDDEPAGYLSDDSG